MKNENQNSTQAFRNRSGFSNANRKKPANRRSDCGCGVSKEFKDRLQKNANSDNNAQKQPINRFAGVKKESSISKEFKGLPVIPARLLREMNVDINAAAKKTIQNSNAPNKLMTTKGEMPQTHHKVSSKEQENLKTRFIDFWKSIISE